MSAREDVDAIYRYVREQRLAYGNNPRVLALIQDFEAWYQTLSPVDFSTTALDEARRRRFELNRAMGVAIPDTWVPADAPQTPPPVSTSGGVWRELVPLAIGAVLAYAALQAFERDARRRSRSW